MVKRRSNGTAVDADGENNTVSQEHATNIIDSIDDQTEKSAYYSVRSDELKQALVATETFSFFGFEGNDVAPLPVELDADVGSRMESDNADYYRPDYEAEETEAAPDCFPAYAAVVKKVHSFFILPGDPRLQQAVQSFWNHGKSKKEQWEEFEERIPAVRAEMKRRMKNAKSHRRNKNARQQFEGGSKFNGGRGKVWAGKAKQGGNGSFDRRRPQKKAHSNESAARRQEKTARF